MIGFGGERVGRIACALACIAAACGVLPSAVSPAAARGVSPPSAGESDRGLTTGLAGVVAREPVVFQRIVSSGASFVHIFVPWGRIGPRHPPAGWQPADPADPSYDWSSVDSAVSEAARVGLEPVLMVHGAPVWAQRCEGPGLVWVPVCNPDPALLATFATAAARRYSGSFADLPRVRYWQGLNEPNLSLFFEPQLHGGTVVSPDLYRSLINAFYLAVKGVHHSNLVLAAGLGPIARHPWTIGPMDFARRLLCMRGRSRPRPTHGNCDGGVRFDIFDVHPYTTGGPNHRGRRDDVQLGDLEKLRTLLAAADRAGRIKGRFERTPLWVTEFTWDSNPPDPGGLSMGIAARWTSEALHAAWRAGVSHFFWYPLRDESTGGLPFSETIQGGLYFRGATVVEDRPKRRLLQAFRFPFVAHSRPSGFFFWGRTSNSDRGRVTIQIRKGAGWHDVDSAWADRKGIFSGVARGEYGRQGRGAVRARYRGERSIPFSLRPVRGFYQPPFGRPQR